MDVFLKYISRGGPNGVDDDSGGGGGGGGNKVCFIFTTPLAKYRPVFPRDIDISGVPGLLLLTPFLPLARNLCLLPTPSFSPAIYPTHRISSLRSFAAIYIFRGSPACHSPLFYPLPSRALASSFALAGPAAPPPGPLHRRRRRQSITAAYLHAPSQNQSEISIRRRLGVGCFPFRRAQVAATRLTRGPDTRLLALQFVPGGLQSDANGKRFSHANVRNERPTLVPEFRWVLVNSGCRCFNGRVNSATTTEAFKRESDLTVGMKVCLINLCR